ncbi:hypothetical protein V6N13_032455 [Hibiscus sabdariffa]
MGLEERTSSGERTWCGEGIKCFNNEPMDHGFGYECMNDSGDCSSGSRSGKMLYWITCISYLSGDEGGIQRCIQDALLFHRENGCNVTFKDSEELEAVISNGSFKESKPQTTTEMCQHVFCEVTEKFTSLCKLLFDNFQGIKLDSLFHLSLINSRMKYGAYEQSPMLFSSDIQQIGCSGVDVEEEKREVPSFPDNIAMEILWLSKCRGLLFLRQ